MPDPRSVIQPPVPHVGAPAEAGCGCHTGGAGLEDAGGFALAAFAAAGIGFAKVGGGAFPLRPIASRGVKRGTSPSS